jgi:RNA polymerase sigma-70 factor (ECF subfamily)
MSGRSATIERHMPAPAPAAVAAAERELLDRYISASEHDDVDALVSLLREEALLRMPRQRSLIGAVQIARFFRDTAASGDLKRLRLTATWANGRPAVAIHRRTADRVLVPHGISVLETDGERIVRIDTFLGAELLPRFGFPTDHRRDG